MKRFFAFLLSMLLLSNCTFSALAVGDGNETDNIMTVAVDNIESNAIITTAENYLLAATRNMWLYESNDLSVNTLSRYISETQATMSTSPIFSELTTLNLSDTELERLNAGLDFVENKVLYFKSIRQSQNILRNDFNIEYSVMDVIQNGSTAQTQIYEYISFRYPDFPDTLSEVVNIYTVDLIEIDGKWLVADVTAENDWFDDTFKELGFDAINPEKSFQLAETQADEVAQVFENVNLIDADLELIEPRASTSVLYNYNPTNATAYAYTYATSKYSNVDNQTTAQRADAETYWNENFAKFSGTDCMNFASQCMWAGFGGSNESSKIYNPSTGAHASPMDSTGTYQWCGTIRGQEYQSDTVYWRSCKYFRDYLDSESKTTLPDFYATVKEVTGTAGFSSAVSSSSDLIGAVLHVNSGGHAIVVTDATGLARNQVLFTAHTSDRKGVKVSEYWNSGTITVIIPKQIRVYNPEEVKITATLQRPVPVGTTLSLTSAATVSCSSLTMKVTKDSTSYGTTSVSGLSSISRSFTFSTAGLYTITTTAKKAASSTPITYVYTIRVYE